jgi:hypothetical protein
MMDASEILPNGFHPVKHYMNPDFSGSVHQIYTRTQRPPKYYWIDFGLSVRFHESKKSPLAYTLRGNDRSVPEFQDYSQLHQKRDPFPTDIYYLGNLVRRFFTEVCSIMLFPC